MEQHITTIFATDTLHIDNLDCSGLCGGHEHVREEIALRHEIVLPRYGVFQRYDAFGCQIVDVNYLAFFNSNQPHEISHPIDGGDGCMIINLRDDVLREILQAIDPTVIERDKPFLSSGILLDSSQQLAKQRLLNYLVDVLRKRHASPLQITDVTLEVEETVLAFIAAMLATSYEVDITPVPNPLYAHTVRAIQTYLNSHYAENFTLSDIAAHVHYSPYLLCRIFKHQIGLTIHQYLARLRLFHALELLIAEPTLPVGDIALQLGFYSHSHFTAVFSQTFNVSPSDYRQQASLRQFNSLRQQLRVS